MGKLDFVIGLSYEYKAIDAYVQAYESLDLVEHGGEFVGRNFLVIINQDKLDVVSFVLDGATRNGYIYRCVYNDIKE